MFKKRQVIFFAASFAYQKCGKFQTGRQVIPGMPSKAISENSFDFLLFIRKILISYIGREGKHLIVVSDIS